MSGAASTADLVLRSRQSHGADVREAPNITTPATLIADTPNGRVRGYESDGIRIFKGIPYAGPTGGTARFMAPNPVQPWRGVRDCLTLGPICPQPAGDRPGTSFAFLMQPINGIQDEDCLNLNIWTPALDGRRPVMVWIHGGNFSTGSSLALPATDGEALARRGDVVVVSVNHRLNAFGYLDLVGIGAPARFATAINVGMLDLVAALAWIRETIGRFGGDAENITLFGQSGGGLKITTLCAMPRAKGLFHKAIVESGSESQVFGPEMTEPLTRELLRALDIAPTDAEKLQAVPTVTLAATAAKVMAAWTAQAKGDIWKLVGWAPRIDHDVIPAQPYERANFPLSGNIPLLVGSTRHEFIATMFSDAAENMTAAQMRAALARNYDDPDKIIAAFAKAYPNEKPVSLAAIISAASFNRTNAVTQAQAKAALGGAPAWLYQFNWETPMLDGTPRAYHTAELPLAFYNVGHVPEATGTGPAAWRMAERMSNAWIAFARHGDPNHAGLPAWPAVHKDTAPTMIFDNTCVVAEDADRALRIMAAREKRFR